MNGNKEHISISDMTFDGIPLTKANDRAAESGKQDQTECMCRLTLLYTLRKINPFVANVMIRVKNLKSKYMLLLCERAFSNGNPSICRLNSIERE